MPVTQCDTDTPLSPRCWANLAWERVWPSTSMRRHPNSAYGFSTLLAIDPLSLLESLTGLPHIGKRVPYIGIKVMVMDSQIIAALVVAGGATLAVVLSWWLGARHPRSGCRCRARRNSFAEVNRLYKANRCGAPVWANALKRLRRFLRS